MAKKARKENKKSPKNALPENMLPQNMMSIGERVEEDKNIYISQAVYKEIHKFTKNKSANESGGMLVGSIIEEFGKTNIVICGFIEAKFCEATPTTLTFTHETWEYVHKEIEKKYKGKQIVGWIHTHPDFGIFLSEYDKFIHQNFFNEAHQVAYVIDPIQNIEGFYFWIHSNIEKCKGFYIYDNIGTQITVDTGKDKPISEKTGAPLFSIKNILPVILSVAVAFLVFANISTNNKLKKVEEEQRNLEAQQITLTGSANQAFYQMQQLIYDQDFKIQELTNILKEAGIIVEANDPVGPDNNSSPDAETGDAEQGTTDVSTDTTAEGIVDTTEGGIPANE